MRTSPNFGNQSGTHDRDKTHCVDGHEFTPENTRIRERKNRQGVVTGRMRVCVTCNKRRSHEHRIDQLIVKYARELGMLKE